METAKLKKFAQFARRSLMEQVSSKLKLVLDSSSAPRRDRPEAVKKLEEAIKGSSKEKIVERVAYTWFNRFCALRFMDVKRYNRVNIVSPADPGQFQPEILAEAKMGHMDEDMVSEKIRQQVFALLDGKAPSRDPQAEAFRLLLVAACNFWNKAMPFLFQRIDDYTELLMPDDLLSGNSILAYTREAMTPNACEEIEVIGWLYQFYVSEKKDEVFASLKKNKKITPENIPAATQLFTPDYIVQYLVENSLGRLWLLNRPGSSLGEKMDYYIKPEQVETDFLRIGKPEEIRICDPACGSGHMLTYAFDLLYAIYEEEGYESAEIPEKILTHNLYGIEIDERAGELAAFALTMKARARQRRFFNKGVRPNICVLENVHFSDGEIKEYMDFVGRNLFTAPLQTTLHQFEEADNFGSLIRPDVTDVEGMLKILELKSVSGQLFLNLTHQKALKALRQADYLSPKYHVVIANPPYMGGKGMNGQLKKWAGANFSDSKSDLFAMFMERGLSLVVPKGMTAMINMQSWMFLTSFEKLRTKLLDKYTLLTMAHLGERAFDSIGGAVVSTTSFVFENAPCPIHLGDFVRLVEGKSEIEKADMLIKAINDVDCGWRYYAKAEDFKKIPGRPIVYWISRYFIDSFENISPASKNAQTLAGMQTGDNETFVRRWHEVSVDRSNFGASSREEAERSGKKWFPYNKGGAFRKWYGNQESLVDWGGDGKIIKEKKKNDLSEGKITANNSKCWNQSSYFRPGVTWTKVSSGIPGFRLQPKGAVFDIAGVTLFPNDDQNIYHFLGALNSKYSRKVLEMLSPTLNFETSQVSKVPIKCDSINLVKVVTSKAKALVHIGKSDWNNFEISWDFTNQPLLNPEHRQLTLKATYQKLRSHWQEMTLEMMQLEEENNRIFIEAYSLKEALDKKVDINEITLTCNPYYRYGNNKSEEELEALLLADTMRELVSYAVGCMFGRYAIDNPGLILANQGETIEDYLKKVPEPIFPADDDNVIPMLDGDWFTDDIVERFRKFLRVAFGEEHYEENLRFVEQALNIKGKRKYGIRDYFLSEFYTDHWKRYKKRPIYWLFSSPKGSFNALIYMHRYRPDTVSIVLKYYLREFRTKLSFQKNHLEAVTINASSSQGEKTKALKEIEKITKMISEMEEYEREVLYPLATEQKEIDLDDGVKVNYPKFGKALKKIPGLSVKEG